MPNFKPYTKRHLSHTLQSIGEAVYTASVPLDIHAWWSKEPLPFTNRTSGKELILNVGDQWGALFDCAWFHFTATVPESAAGQHVVLLLDVNGEMCVFDEQGVPARGLTTVTSGYDYSLGRPAKGEKSLISGLTRDAMASSVNYAAMAQSKRPSLLSVMTKSVTCTTILRRC